MHRLGLVVQARMGSSRLPGKVLADVGGKSAIARVLDRVSKIRAVGKIVVAIPNTPDSKPLADELYNLNYEFYMGSEHDVLDRYYQLATAEKFDTIVRITGDCPLLDPDVSTRVIQAYTRGRYDFFSNCRPTSTYPDGLDTEVFSYDTLCKAWTHAKGVEREHVTQYMYRRGKFRAGRLYYPANLSHYRWTLDTEDDLQYIRKVYELLGDRVFGMKEILRLPIQRFANQTQFVL